MATSRRTFLQLVGAKSLAAAALGRPAAAFAEQARDRSGVATDAAGVIRLSANENSNGPGENVLAHTAHLYQPGTRRPYGVLEWPAMLRLLDAEQKNSAFPPYWR
jgi:hypothetical protein